MVCPIVVSESKYEVDYQRVGEEKILSRGKDVVYLKDGTCRLPTISHFREVVLDETGFKVEKISNYPTFTGMSGESDYGVEDARITKIEDKYYMTYVGVSIDEGVSTYLAVSKDLKKWKRMGIIFREQNKDAVLFSEKIDGEYVALNRPESLFDFSRPGIWISYSKDLIYWGRDKNVFRGRENSWDSARVGAGPPPIITKFGWLLIYHGVENIAD